MSQLTMYFPILLVIGANVLYHLTAKAVPEEMNSFAALIVVYFCAMVIAIVLFFATSPNKNLAENLSHLNLPTVLMSLALLGMELGTILMFKVGWDVSIGPLIAHIGLCVVLVIVGVLFFKEKLSMTQAVGIILCLIGMVLANKT